MIFIYFQNCQNCNNSFLNKKKMDNHNQMISFLKVNWPDSLKKLGFDNHIISFSQEIVDFIMEDQIFLNEAWRGQKDESEGVCKRFPVLEDLINSIVEEYEGNVFIKLNWWSPKDCENWLPQFQCQNMYDIFLALKSSAFLMDMLQDYKEWLPTILPPEVCIATQNQQNGYFLELRQWYKLRLEREFRCFVINGKLKGISQKNLFMVGNVEAEIKERIIDFFEKNIKEKFPESRFVFDVYLNPPPKKRIILVDIGPWREFSSSKLFTFNELEQMESEEVLLRLVKTKDQIIQEDFSAYRMPCEFTEAENHEQLIKMLTEKIEKQYENELQS